MDDITISENTEQISVSDNTIEVPYSGWNEQILDGFDHIVSDLPSNYGYLVFEDSGSYYLFSGSQYSVQENHIYFGSDCKVAVASLNQDHVTFTPFSSPDFDYEVESGTLVYTNLLPDYPDLKADNLNIPLFLSFVMVTSSFWFIINRGSRR